MAKDLSMNGRKKIETIQKEFTGKFNYLTLLFLDEENKSLDVSKSLSEVRTQKGADISIVASLKVNTLEQRFRDHFGIKVEVAYFLDGKIVHTKANVDKTLNELNEWCSTYGCDKFDFKKSLTGNTLLSIQEQLFNAIKEQFPDAEAKKINKDSCLDIHLPGVNSKRGTHLFFNTGKNEIKIGFYCRDEEFVDSVLENSENIEKYAQGIRIAGNPTYPDVQEALAATIEFLSQFPGIDPDHFSSNEMTTPSFPNNTDMADYEGTASENNSGDNVIEELISPYEFNHFHHLAMIYQIFAIKTDGVLGDVEKNKIFELLNEWVDNPQATIQILQESSKFLLQYDEKYSDKISDILNYLGRQILKAGVFTESNLNSIVADLNDIALSDSDEITENEKMFISYLAELWGLEV
jgi:serine/threonine protein phosphatase PrpC